MSKKNKEERYKIKIKEKKIICFERRQGRNSEKGHTHNTQAFEAGGFKMEEMCGDLNGRELGF